MRLRKAQKEAVIAWIAEGLLSDEINERAGAHVPPFNVSRQQVDYYRKSREAELAAMVAAGEADALSTGLALKEERVKSLKRLAALMERDLFGGFLWTDQVKSLHDGDSYIPVDYEEFNRSEVDAYRGVLDDIAKETGGRVTKLDSLTRNIDLAQLTDSQIERLANGEEIISVLANPGAGGAGTPTQEA